MESEYLNSDCSDCEESEFVGIREKRTFILLFIFCCRSLSTANSVYPLAFCQ